MTLSQKRNVKIITVASVVMIFLLFLVLATCLIQRAQLSAIKNGLSSQMEQLNEYEKDLYDKQDYRNTLEFIEKYAREELGMIAAWETLWKAKNK